MQHMCGTQQTACSAGSSRVSRIRQPESVGSYMVFKYLLWQHAACLWQMFLGGMNAMTNSLWQICLAYEHYLVEQNYVNRP